MTYDEDGCLALAGAIIQQALKERGPSWLLLPQGLYWCEITGLNPNKLYRQAVVACNEWKAEAERFRKRRRPHYGA